MFEDTLTSPPPKTPNTSNTGREAGRRGRTRFNRDVFEGRLQRLRAPLEDFQKPSPTAEQNHDSLASAGIVRMATTNHLVSREVILQEWEGQVQEIDRDFFSARLVDLTSGEEA